MYFLKFEKKFFERINRQGFQVIRADYDRDPPDRFLSERSHAWLIKNPLASSLRTGKSIQRVVFVHGTGNDLLFPQIELIEALLTDGHEVFLFDLDGHGRWSTTRFDEGEVSSCLRAALIQAERVGGVRATHLLGHSLGACLVARFLADSQSTATSHGVQSAILLSIPTRKLTFAASWSELATVLRPSAWHQLLVYGFKDVWPAYRWFRRRTYPVRLRQSGSHSEDYLSVVQRQFSDVPWPEVGAKIRLPILGIFGGWDQIAPARSGEGFIRSIAQGSFVSVARETHCSLPFAGETIKAIRNWLLSRA